MDIRVLLFCAAILLAGAFFFFLGLRNWRWKRLIENTPTSKIRGLAMGLVEICGSVTKPLKKYLKSPFTGKDCVYYEYQIQELRSNGKQTYWATISSGTDSVPFYLNDKTAAVLVEPQGATINVPHTYNSQTSSFKQVPDKVKSFCAARNISTQSWFFGMSKSMKFVERSLPAGETVYIMGTAGDNPYVEEATAQKGVEDVMIQKGKNVPFYYITQGTEKDALKQFAWKVYGGLFGGAAMVIVGLVGIFFYFGVL